MAKGRRHQTRGSERLLGSLAYSGSAGRAASASAGDLTDLSEYDVWSSQTFSGGGDDFRRVVPSESGAPEPNRARQWAPSVPDHRQLGGLSLAFDDGYDAARQTVVHQYRNMERAAAEQGRSGGTVAASAPVNVPSWPSYLRMDAAEAANEAGAYDGAADDDDEWLPPHEYLARENRGSTMATSVFEGVGRTLKGRDMSRVRDAVWSQTGFFG